MMENVTPRHLKIGFDQGYVIYCIDDDEYAITPEEASRMAVSLYEAAVLAKMQQQDIAKSN
jgi:hypothetical protein